MFVTSQFNPRGNMPSSVPANKKRPQPDSSSNPRGNGRGPAVGDNQATRNQQNGNGPPSIHDYLDSDAQYGAIINQLNKNLSDYTLTNKDTRSDLRQDYRRTRRGMETEKTHALDSMTEDYASRGILNSGVFNTDVGDYNQQFTKSVGDLGLDKQRGLDEMLRQLKGFRHNTQAERENARLEAIRRRASRFGIT